MFSLNLKAKMLVFLKRILQVAMSDQVFRQPRQITYYVQMDFSMLGGHLNMRFTQHVGLTSRSEIERNMTVPGMNTCVRRPGFSFEEFLIPSIQGIPAT